VNELVGRVFLQVVVFAADLLSQLVSHNRDFELLPIDLEPIHLLDCDLGVFVPSELNDGVTFVSASHWVSRQLDVLNIAEGIEPLN
jgi:hypothetical protein